MAKSYFKALSGLHTKGKSERRAIPPMCDTSPVDLGMAPRIDGRFLTSKGSALAGAVSVSAI